MDEYYPDDYPDYYGNEGYYDAPEESNDLSLTKAISGIGGEDEAKVMMENVIDEVAERYTLKKDEAIILLTNFNWNKDKIEMKWWDDMEGIRIQCGLDYDKKLKLVPTDNKFCSVCYSENTKENQFIALTCEHYFCKECWKDYFNCMVQNKLTCVNTPCRLKD